MFALDVWSWGQGASVRGKVGHVALASSCKDIPGLSTCGRESGTRAGQGDKKAYLWEPCGLEETPAGKEDTCLPTGCGAQADGTSSQDFQAEGAQS